MSELDEDNHDDVKEMKNGLTKCEINERGFDSEQYITAVEFSFAGRHCLDIALGTRVIPVLAVGASPQEIAVFNAALVDFKLKSGYGLRIVQTTMTRKSFRYLRGVNPGDLNLIWLALKAGMNKKSIGAREVMQEDLRKMRQTKYQDVRDHMFVLTSKVDLLASVHAYVVDMTDIKIRVRNSLHRERWNQAFLFHFDREVFVSIDAMTTYLAEQEDLMHTRGELPVYAKVEDRSKEKLKHVYATLPVVPVVPGVQPRNLADIICYRCGKHGHYRNTCPDNMDIVPVSDAKAARRAKLSRKIEREAVALVAIRDLKADQKLVEEASKNFSGNDSDGNHSGSYWGPSFTRKKARA